MRTTGRLILLLWLLAGSACAAPGLTTTARLVLSHQAALPGETIWAGIHLRLQRDWHIYWQNSGDSGIPTKVEWTAVPGLAFGELQWPAPGRFEEAGLVTYGFTNEVVLLAPVTIASNASPGALKISAKVSWMECNAAGCVPGAAPLSVSLSVGPDSKPSSEVTVIEQWRARLPASQPRDFAQAWWEKEATEQAVRPLVIDWPAAQASASVRTNADFYSFALSNVLVRTGVEHLEAPAGRIHLRKEVEKLEGDWPRELSGLLVEPSAGNGQPRALRVTLSLTNPPAGAPAQTVDSRTRPDSTTTNTAPGSAPWPNVGKNPLIVWLAYALLGGLILNLMPCVLPVIALKIFGFVGQSQDSPARVRKLGLMYLVGVLVSFLVLAGLVVGLKSLGKQVSWGMQFGDARLLVVLTTLVTLVALNLFGLFEVTLGSGTMGAASSLASKEGMSGAFFNGVLATILSTPCSAPYLAGAVGFAFAPQTTSISIVLVFLCVGFGLALPYVLLSFEPRWLKFLPKPGPWMERFKVLMGFPMLATAVWLFTLTALHYQNVLWLGFFLVIIALAAWVFGQFVQRGQKRKPLALVIVGLLLLIGYGYGLETKQRWRHPRPPSLAGGDEIIQEGPDGIEWRRWSPARVQQARAQGRPVFVDFTATWCVTCNVNKNTSIEIDSVRKKLKQINAVALLGDYTLFPPEILEELQRFGQASVPLVLVYPRDAAKPPVALPSLLTPKIVLDALEQAAR